MKKALFISLLFVLTAGLIMGCGANEDEEAYNYISTEELAQRLDNGDLESGDMIMVSSQTEEEWDSAHLPDSIATHARPLETDEDFAKLDDALATIEEGDMDVIILCPGGGSGATRPFDYFEENGVDTDRLLILSGGVGQMEEDYPDYVVSND